MRMDPDGMFSQKLGLGVDSNADMLDGPSPMQTMTKLERLSHASTAVPSGYGVVENDRLAWSVARHRIAEGGLTADV